MINDRLPFTEIQTWAFLRKFAQLGGATER